jgi:hypothetical protein
MEKPRAVAGPGLPKVSRRHTLDYADENHPHMEKPKANPAKDDLRLPFRSTTG